MYFSSINFPHIDFFTNESQNNYVTKGKIKPGNMGNLRIYLFSHSRMTLVSLSLKKIFFFHLSLL
jgi:hypothetical protein